MSRSSPRPDSPRPKTPIGFLRNEVPSYLLETQISHESNESSDSEESRESGESFVSESNRIQYLSPTAQIKFEHTATERFDGPEEYQPPVNPKIIPEQSTKHQIKKQSYSFSELMSSVFHHPSRYKMISSEELNTSPMGVNEVNEINEIETENTLVI